MRKAEKSIAFIEGEVEKAGQSLEPVDESKAIEVKPTEKHGYLSLLKVLFSHYPKPTPRCTWPPLPSAIWPAR